MKYFLNLRIYLLLLLFSLTTKLVAQNAELSQCSKVSVLTCGSGDELYSIYGHSAIRIKDSLNNIDLVYNYGYFDFNTPNFYLKFVKGDMQYFGAVDSFESFINEYRVTNRTVYEQDLILTFAEKQKLLNQLNVSIFSDNRFYVYKFIDKNCTTMVLDKINIFYKNSIINSELNNNNSYRLILYQYLENHFWENLGINVIFGEKVDHRVSNLFLPLQLLKSLENTRVEGNPIANKTIVLNKRIDKLKHFNFWNSIYLLIIFLTLIIFINKKSIYLGYLLIIGLLGLFFLFVGLYSFHEEIRWNYNALLFNPTFLLLIYFFLLKNGKFINRIIDLNYICIGLYIIIVFNKVHFWMVLPLVLTNSIILYKVRNLIDHDKIKR